MAIRDVLVGNEIFIQGKYLALGINGSGSLGTKQTGPAGIFTDNANGFNRLGMYADFDGFGTGKAPTMTETMLDGTPTEGFSIGYSTGGSTYVAVNQERTAKTAITGVVSDRSANGVAKAGWTGTTTEKLGVDQTISLTDDGKYVRVDVTLTNTSNATMANLRYMRSIDPDHGTTFNTDNRIISQSGASGALVAAYAGASPFFYYAQDARAVVSTTAGYRSVDPYTAEVSTTPQAAGYSLKGDNIVNISFDLGTLTAGQATKLTFYMGVTDNLDTTIAAINSATPPTTTPVNIAPVATDDLFALVAGSSVTGNVLANDRDGNGDTLSASVTSGPKNGTLSLNKDGSFVYKAAAGFIGIDSFAYAASDGKASSGATVTLTVAAAANAAPTAVNDAYTLTSGGSAKGYVLANDSDANGDVLSAALKTGPANGTVTLVANGTFVYTPKAGFSGTDSFTYTASDGKAGSTATVTLTVKPPVNIAPVATADAYTTVTANAFSGNVLSNDRDADGNALTAAVKTGPANGTLSLASDGSFVYTAKAGFVGADSFTYTASDGLASSSATVSLTIVPPPNTAPTVANDAFTSIAGAVVTGNVLVNDSDADGDVLRAVLQTGPASGTLSLADDGSFRYTPKVGFAGKDSFTYVATDGAARSIATVSLTVTPPPTSTTDTILTRAGTQDGSASGNQKLVGPAYHNSFYIDSTGVSGNDRIMNFSHDDVLVTTGALFDGNLDGIVSASGTRALLDGPSGTDQVRIDGIFALRDLGLLASGLHVYAEAAVRPIDAIEGILGSDTLVGDAGDTTSQTFFFDTALDLDLGSDVIVNFGGKDIMVTTTALFDGNGDRVIAFGRDGTVQLVGGSGAPGDSVIQGEAGHVTLSAIGGGAIGGLEFDGSVVRNGSTYYVYSLVGSAAGLDALHG